MSCGGIAVDSCCLLFVLAIRFREILGYVILQQRIAAYGNLQLLFMTTLNSGLSKQVFWSSYFCPSNLACNFSGPQTVQTLRPKRLSCPM